MSPLALGERLAVKIYTSDDGLGSSAAFNLVRDRRGFIWICSRDGLVRFDGYRFITYKIGGDDADPSVFSVLPTGDDVYWINLNRGTDYRFIRPADDALVSSVENSGGKNDPRVPLKVEPVSADALLPGFEDEEGNLWTADTRGLLKLHDVGGRYEGESITLDLPGNPVNELQRAVYKEAKGDGFWIGTHWGLVRRFTSGKTVHFTVDPHESTDTVYFYDEDTEHRIWIARPGGVIVLKTAVSAESDSQQRSILRTAVGEGDGRVTLPQTANEAVFYPFSQMMPRDTVNASQPGYQMPEIYSIVAARDGRVWMSSNHGLIVFDKDRFQQFTTRQGLAADVISSLAEDKEGQIWALTYGGLHRINPNGLTTFDESDGLERARINSIYQTKDGELYTVSGNFNISRREADGTFKMVRPQLPPKSLYSWQSNAAFIDSRGDWWVNTMDAVYRFSGVKRFEDLDNMRPTAVYGETDGMLSGNIMRIFEDSRGDMWFSPWVTSKRLGLSRWSRATGKFDSFQHENGLPKNGAASAFAEDNSGGGWFGFIENGISRFRDGKFTQLTEPNMPQGGVININRDGKGRLWISTGREGLFRVDDPGAEHPIFRRYTIADGLSSNNVRCVVDDEFGNIYIGTVHGVDRLSPETGQIRYYGTSDGLASDFINTALRDHDGVIWFGTFNGLSKLVPAPDPPMPVPAVFIGALRIAGIDYSVSPLGQHVVNVPDQNADQNNVQIEYFSAGSDSSTQYQYRLEGSEGDWSSPTTERVVNFSSLAPGSYRFLVRAVTQDGVTSSEPAAVSFTVLRPLYRRWWFLGLVSIAFAGTLLMLYRYRVNKSEQVREAVEELSRSRQERLLELERVRSRIAADLHDDIGSSLSQIAVLSEFAKHGNGHQANGSDTLEQISDVSNELVEAMSDIVWAIDPRKDNFHDVLQRMRRFAADIFTAKGIKFRFDAPEFDERVQFGADVRRELFVIYKEAVNNIARHSGADEAWIRIDIAGESLSLEISDNGHGFDVESLRSSTFSPGMGGNGLANIRKRASGLGADLTIESSEHGTRISLTLAVSHAAARDRTYPHG